MMRALVTGCAGFIGSTLVDGLLAQGWQVTGIDRFSSGYPEAVKLTNLAPALADERFELVRADLAEEPLEALVAGHDAIFHLAAEPGVHASWGARYRGYLRDNVLATQRLLEAIGAAGGTARVVLASSSSVYGEPEIVPTPEETPPHPRSPYAQSKLAAEQLCDLYAAERGLDTVSLRYFSVFGERQRPDMAFNRFCRAALAGERLTINGDGRQTRDFTYVGDVVRTTIAAATAPLGAERTFNVGGGAPASVLEALEVIAALTGRELAVEHVARPPGDVRATGADTTRAEALLGHRSEVTLADGLSAELEWLTAADRAAPVGH